MESFADFCEEVTVRIIEHVRARPMDGRVGNQGKADSSCEIDRLDNVIGLG